MTAARTIMTYPGQPLGFIDADRAGQSFGGPINTHGYVAGIAIPPEPWTRTSKTAFPTSLRGKSYGYLFGQFEQEIVANIVATDLAGTATPIIDRYINLYRAQQLMTDTALADLRTQMATFVTDYLAWLAL